MSSSFNKMIYDYWVVIDTLFYECNETCIVMLCYYSYFIVIKSNNGIISGVTES